VPTDREGLSVTDFLDEKRREINDRLAELKPIVEEYGQLQTMSDALAGIPTAKNGVSASTPPPTSPKRRGRGRPRGSKKKTVTATATTTATKLATKKGPKRRVGRRKGTGKRGAEAVALIQAHPGITITELASKIGIKPNYLYRVIPDLEQEKKITKAGPRLHPAK
jgi:Winged helix-turn-helix DNA-binding